MWHLRWQSFGIPSSPEVMLDRQLSECQVFFDRRGSLPRRPSGERNAAGRRLRHEPVHGGWRRARMRHRASRRSAARDPGIDVRLGYFGRAESVRVSPVFESSRRAGLETGDGESGVGVTASARRILPPSAPCALMVDGLTVPRPPPNEDSANWEEAKHAN